MGSTIKRGEVADGLGEVGRLKLEPDTAPAHLDGRIDLRADAEEWGQNHVAWTFTHALGRKPDVMDSDDGAEGRDVALWNAAWAAAMPSLTASA